MSSPTPQPLHNNIFNEARSIVVSHYLHFVSVACLFFIPLFFSLVSLPYVLRTVQQGGWVSSTLGFTTQLALLFIYALLAFSLLVAGIATITFSASQAFHQTPLRLSTTFKSLSLSFFPLAYTILTFLPCLILTSIAPLFLAGSRFCAIKIFGFELNYFFSICVLAVSVLAGLFLVFCQFYFTIAGVFAVVESNWGFNPLRRSYYLISKMKSETVISLFLHGVIDWVFVLGLSYPFLISSWTWSYLDVIIVFAFSLCDAYLMLQYLVASTILYLYYGNDLSGESRVESEEEDENSGEYTGLAMEDDDNMVSNESQVETRNDWTQLMIKYFITITFLYEFNWIIRPFS